MNVSTFPPQPAGLNLPGTDAWTLSRLLAPNSVEEFRDDYWGRKPLLIARNMPRFYAGLFALGDIERYLGQRDIFRRHVITTPEEGRGMPLPPPASLAELAHRFAGGASMRIRSLEQFIDPAEPVMQLVRDIERQIAHPLASVSAYVSPKDGRGLGPHHDNSEIFTLQISGRKTWRLFHHVSSLEPAIYPREDLGEPVAEITLLAGDLLFCPAGWVHDVSADEAYSISLTLVFNPFRGLSVLDLLTARLSTAPAFLATLPADGYGADFEAAFADLKRLAHEALEELRADDLARTLGIRLLVGMAEPGESRLESAMAITELVDSSFLIRTPGQDCIITKDGLSLLVTVSSGYSFRTYESAEPQLRKLLMSEGPVPLGGVVGLDAETRCQLGRELVLSGLMRIVPP